MQLSFSLSLFLYILPVFSADETAQFYTVGNTIVSYTANYNLGSALAAGEDLIQAVNTSVFEELKNQTINSSDIDNEYLATTALKQLETGKLSFETFVLVLSQIHVALLALLWMGNPLVQNLFTMTTPLHVTTNPIRLLQRHVFRCDD